MPIDANFKNSRKIASKHEGHDVWGPVEPPKVLGIHGSVVAVDFDLCTGDGTCIDVCPAAVFEWLNTPEHPTSEKKSDPLREVDCIYCMACETQCPVQAIKISQP